MPARSGKASTVAGVGASSLARPIPTALRRRGGVWVGELDAAVRSLLGAVADLRQNRPALARRELPGAFHRALLNDVREQPFGLEVFPSVCRTLRGRAERDRGHESAESARH